MTWEPRPQVTQRLRLKTASCQNRDVNTLPQFPASFHNDQKGYLISTNGYRKPLIIKIYRRYRPLWSQSADAGRDQLWRYVLSRRLICSLTFWSCKCWSIANVFPFRIPFGIFFFHFVFPQQVCYSPSYYDWAHPRYHFWPFVLPYFEGQDAGLWGRSKPVIMEALYWYREIWSRCPPWTYRRRTESVTARSEW